MSRENIYSATYSNIPVYEYQFGPDLKEHVMRRRHDDWINATHILKAAGFDKPARTRILEREVQKDVHEKIQGGYGKYQGTWVPLEAGQALAIRNNVFEKLRPIFEFVPGDQSPPPAPKHTTNKPKAPKRPPVPRWKGSAPSRVHLAEDPYDEISTELNEDETPDDTTVASASFIDDDDMYDHMSQPPTGHRKRKRDEPPAPSLLEQAHTVYSDELLDYFMLSQSEPARRPEPPANYQPDWIIDPDKHTALHWACAMGDIDVIKQLKRFNANLNCSNIRGETPLMRAVLFTNCYDKQTMPKVVEELVETVGAIDNYQSTVIHHAAAMTSSKRKHTCARYYLDVLLNKIEEHLGPEDMGRLLDAQDIDGNTACHIAAKFRARKCVRALLGRGVATDIPNNEGQTAQQLIQELNNSRQSRNTGASSSPFAPDSSRNLAFMGSIYDAPVAAALPHHSEAALTIESKITPLILEKFHHLARSFDEELTDRNKSEKEAKQILQTTNADLRSVREQILELERLERETDVGEEELEELQQIKKDVLTVVEQNQRLRLMSLLAQQQGDGVHKLANGNGNIDLAQQRLAAEQQRRVELVEAYVDALSLADMDGRGKTYRALIVKCLGVKEDEIDSSLDGLISVLEEDQVDGEGVGRTDMIMAHD